MRIKLTTLLAEIQNKKYDFGCVMLYFDFPKIKEIHKLISKEDIFESDGDLSFGLETEPHCTLLYGLHEEVTLEQVENILNNQTYFTCAIHNVSLFENEEFDVLKFDVYSPTSELIDTNKELKELPYTSKFPDFHPHLTIAFLKSGTGKKYVEMFKDLEYELTPKYAFYSQPNGEKDRIKIKVGN